MWEYIVLGQIPGTSFQLGFIGYLILFDIGLVIYFLKKYHPEKILSLDKRLKISARFNKLAKQAQTKLRSYEKRLVKKLVHFRDDILSPKLKFLK